MRLILSHRHSAGTSQFQRRRATSIILLTGRHRSTPPPLAMATQCQPTAAHQSSHGRFQPSSLSVQQRPRLLPGRLLSTLSLLLQSCGRTAVYPLQLTLQILVHKCGMRVSLLRPCLSLRPMLLTPRRLQLLGLPLRMAHKPSCIPNLPSQSVRHRSFLQLRHHLLRRLNMLLHQSRVRLLPNGII